MLVKEEVIVVDIINIMDDTAKTKPRIYSTPSCCSRESVVVGFFVIAFEIFVPYFTRGGLILYSELSPMHDIHFVLQ